MSHTLHPLRTPRLQRSELAVPGSNPTMIDKAASGAADYVFLDLEDAVAAEAKEAARYLVLTPPLPVPARIGYSAIAAAAISTLPRWARLPLRLPYVPAADVLVGRPLGEAVTRIFRWVLVEPDEVTTTETPS